MKKRGTLLFLIIILFSLSACNLEKIENTEANKNIKSTEQEEIIIKKNNIENLENTEEGILVPVQEEIQANNTEEELEQLVKRKFGTGFFYLGENHNYGDKKTFINILSGDKCLHYKNQKRGFELNLSKHWDGCKILEVVRGETKDDLELDHIDIIMTSEEERNYGGDFPTEIGGVIHEFDIKKQERKVIKGRNFNKIKDLKYWNNAARIRVLNKDKYHICKSELNESPITDPCIYEFLEENNKYYLNLTFGSKSANYFEGYFLPEIDTHSMLCAKEGPTKDGLFCYDGHIDITSWIKKELLSGITVVNI